MRRFGLSYGVSHNEPIERVASVAKAAEQTGYDSLWLTDTLSNKDIVVSLTLALGATSKLLIGPGVTSFNPRHPVILGNAMANLNELSHGRAVLGLGAGGDPLGVPLGWKPATLQGLKEGIANLRQQWNDGLYRHEGKDVKLRAAVEAPKIMMAATKEKMLQLAGEVADGAIVMGAGNLDLIKRQLEQVDAGLMKSGRSPDSFTKDFWITMAAADNEREAIDEVRPWAAAQCRLLSGWSNLPPSLEKFREDIEKVVAGYDKSHHLSGKATHVQLVSDNLAKAIAIAGTPQECAARLSEVFALGFDRITLALRGGKEGRTARMQTLMETVLSKIS